MLTPRDELTVANFGWIALLVNGKDNGKPAANGAAAAPPSMPLTSPGIPLPEGGYEAALDSYDRQLIAAALETSPHPPLPAT